jgi:hypothetical protein
LGLSGGDLVLVRESAEDLFPADLMLGEVDQLRWPGVSVSPSESFGVSAGAWGIITALTLRSRDCRLRLALTDRRDPCAGGSFHLLILHELDRAQRPGRA